MSASECKAAARHLKFRSLAEQIGASDEWAVQKATIMKEIVVDLAEPMYCELAIDIPGEWSEEQYSEISAAAEEWAKEFGFRMLSRTLEAFGGRLIELAMAPDT